MSWYHDIIIIINIINGYRRRVIISLNGLIFKFI